MPKGLSRLILLFSFALFFIVFFLPQFISLYVDWLWFKDVNFEEVFTVRLEAQAIIGLAGGLAGFIISYINIWFSMRATRGRPVVTTFGDQAIPQLNVLRHVDRLKIVVPILIGWFAGLFASSNWLNLLFYSNRVDSGYADPIFGKDVSFYLFALPAYEIISSTLMFILVASLALSALNYVVKGAVFLTRKGVVSERSASAHLSVMGSLIFLVLAFKTYTGMHAILYSSHGHVRRFSLSRSCSRFRYRYLGGRIFAKLLNRNWYTPLNFVPRLGEVQDEGLVIDLLAEHEPRRLAVGVIDPAAQDQFLVPVQGLAARLVIRLSRIEARLGQPCLEHGPRVVQAVVRERHRLAPVLFVELFQQVPLLVELPARVGAHLLHRVEIVRITLGKRDVEHLRTDRGQPLLRQGEQEVNILQHLPEIAGAKPPHVRGRHQIPVSVVRAARDEDLPVEDHAVFMDLVRWSGPDRFPVEEYRALAREQGLESVRRAWAAHPLMCLPPGPREQDARRLVETILAGYRGSLLLQPVDRSGPLKRASFADLGTIQTPALVLTGDQEIPYLQITADALAYALPTARRLILSGGGHLINLSEPDRYSQAVLEFLGSAS